MSLLPWHTATRLARRKRSRGQALVELALVLPILLLLFAAALDLGRLFYSQITITNAAQQAALEAATDAGNGLISFQSGQPCNATTNRVVCRAVNESQGSFVTVAPGDIAMTCSPTSPCPPTTTALGNTVSIKVTGHFSLLTPIIGVFFGGQNVTLASTATAQTNVAPVGTTSTTSTSSTSTTTSASTSTTTTTTTTTASCTAPVAGFTITPTTGSHYKNKNFPGTPFTFSDTSTIVQGPGCTAVWSWNFGDGSGASSVQNPPAYTYQNAGTYTVTLTVSIGSFSSTTSHTVTVS